MRLFFNYHLSANKVKEYLKRTICQLCILLPGCSLLALPAHGQAQAVILQYHHVSTDTPASTSISPEHFQNHISYLRENNFNIMRLEDVLNSLQSGGQLPDKTAVITFDDAYQSIYTHAFPVLKEAKWPFTIFVSTGQVSAYSESFLSWEQLRELGSHGATLANHTVNHPYLLSKNEEESPEEWLNRINDEIINAEEVIKKETGQSHRLLAYPYGEYNPDIQQLVSNLGFSAFGQQSGPINENSDFTALPRFPLSGIYTSMDTFSVKMQSLAFPSVTVVPESPIIEFSSPSVELTFDTSSINTSFNIEQINCFHNNQAMTLEITNNKVRLNSPTQSTGRRFRYNCTAPGGSGRFYWYSKQWINPAISE